MAASVVFFTQEIRSLHTTLIFHKREIGNFAGGIFSLGGGNLTRSDFDHSNLFQSKNNIL